MERQRLLSALADIVNREYQSWLNRMDTAITAGDKSAVMGWLVDDLIARVIDPITSVKLA